MAEVKTLAQARKDKRIYEISKVVDGDSSWYEISLNDGWMFDDGISCMMEAETVADVLQIVNNEIIEGTPE